tara:strand:+ start:244 stop:600 length:357 start_codon:yes stop_codon:yes gene_type:complete
MAPTTLEDLFSSPGFLAIFFAILLTIGNIIVGVSILPQDKREKGYLVHSLLFGAILISYTLFLFYLFQRGRMLLFPGLVFAYLLFAVPLSRKMNVTLHAIIASLGLVLITTVAAFNLF